MPKFLVDSIAQQRNVVATLRNTLSRQQALHAQTVQEQVGQLAHYRELKATQGQPAE